MSGSHQKTDSTFLAGWAVIIVLFAIFLRDLAFLTDDAYIYFRYAANLAAGLGPVFNPGERVEGFTGPSWLALMAIAKWFTLPLETISMLLGVTFGLLTLIIVQKAGRRLLPDSPAVYSLIAPALLAGNRTFCGWCMGGLETSLFTLLVFWAFYRLAVECEQGTPQKYSAILFASATLTRPEGVLFFGIATLLLLFGERKNAKNLSKTVLWAFSATIPFLLYLIFRFIYYGDLLPNTFYAKVPGLWWALGSRYLTAFSLEYALYLTIPLAIWGVLTATGKARNRLMLCLAIPAPYLVYIAAIGGDHFEFRMLQVVLPFIVLPAQQGVVSLAKRLNKESIRRGTVPALTVCLLLITNIIPLTASRNAVIEKRHHVYSHETPLRSLPIVSGIVRTYKHLYTELHRHTAATRIEAHRSFQVFQKQQSELMQRAIKNGMIESNDSIATSTIGILPYYCNLETIDLLGLTDRFVARRKVDERGRLGHEHLAPSSYLFQRKVDYIPTDAIRFFVAPSEVQHIARAKSSAPVYISPFGGAFFAFWSTRTEAELIEMFKRRGRALAIAQKDKIRKLTMPEE